MIEDSDFGRWICAFSKNMKDLISVFANVRT